MLDMMLATTANSTSVYFGMNHMCKKHNQLFTLDHVESCDAFQGCQDIRKYANKLKDQHILDWEKEERYHGIALFAYVTIQMQNLKECKEATLVSTETPVYVKTGRRKGRPKKTKEIAKTNSTIKQFFAPAQADVIMQ
jgi:hypothetical protein